MKCESSPTRHLPVPQSRGMPGAELFMYQNGLCSCLIGASGYQNNRNIATAAESCATNEVFTMNQPRQARFAATWPGVARRMALP